ncbi:choice-of-anchor M domain-containing protein [Devriesea agamarum]|uniref:choice-of-anchor M domain-containing protein n=1 Tax=Devriesea agamarum TaxID=472569 RepID=UPI00071E38C9|nr:choice-of-anchor M domain-containing protein [Devriesea agamarum]
MTPARPSHSSTRTQPSDFRHRILAAIFAFALASGLILVGGPAAHARVIVLDHGHMDLFTVTASGNQLSLALKEDVTGHHVSRNPGEVIVGVKDQAYTNSTASLPGIGTAGYALPQTQNPSLPWPGWDTQGVAQAGFGSVDIIFSQVKGPGNVYLWQQNPAGGVKPMLANGSARITSGAILTQAEPAHTHANWLFTRPGVYTMAVYARAHKGGQWAQTPAYWYTFSVGTKNIPGAQGTAKPGRASSPGRAERPAGAPGAAPQGQAQSGAMPPGAPGGTDPGAVPGGIDRPAGENPAAPGAQAQQAPTMCTPRTQTDTITTAQADELRPQQLTATGGTITIPANTHVHPNWVFTKPGQYTVRITQKATRTDGKQVTAPVTLRFDVGGHGNADNGHFDLGSILRGGELIAEVKDDRHQPATWAPPETFTFGLSDRAKTTAPAGIGFIAPEGSGIHMISSTQVEGVPWLGANTQHESITGGTTGPVTWTLDAVEGPGALAAFTSGNFGAVVGQRWFGGVKASAASVFSPNQDGTVIRTTTVGVDPEGKPCDPFAASTANPRAAAPAPAAHAPSNQAAIQPVSAQGPSWALLIGIALAAAGVAVFVTALVIYLAIRRKLAQSAAAPTDATADQTSETSQPSDTPDQPQA